MIQARRPRALTLLLALPALLGLPGPAAAQEARTRSVPAPAVQTPEIQVALGRDSASLPLAGRDGMVVSANALASAVGARILARGGNAVDAAVATGFALAVVHPTAGNIGGGGFMVVRLPDGTARSFDFREKAPLAAHPRMFLGPDGAYSYDLHHRSHRSVGVPGTVAGFDLAHAELGRLPWQELVEPAVVLASDGFELTPGLAGSLARVLPSMAPYPASVAAFSRNGEPFEPGDLLRQPDLAATLARIRDRGRDGFYLGETARLVEEEMRRGGGLITLQDLALYEAVEREPVVGEFRGYRIISMPPPSSGGVALIQMLNVLEGFDLEGLGRSSPTTLHLLAEAMRRAYRDRAYYLADPDFVGVPVERLTAKEYGALLREDIRVDLASESRVSDVTLPSESPQTTHYSVVDADGMAVSVTYTLEQGYGSRIVVPGAGFLLNNEMGDFNAAPGLTDERGLIGTDANLAQPGKRMLSSMTPTIVEGPEGLVAVVGSPGGRTIINTVLQVVLNLTEFGMGPQEAVDAPRIHHQWLPDLLRLEGGGFPGGTVERLEAMGHEVQARGTQGRAHIIAVDPATGTVLGAPDRRDPDSGAATVRR